MLIWDSRIVRGIEFCFFVFNYHCSGKYSLLVKKMEISETFCEDHRTEESGIGNMPRTSVP